MDVWILDLLRGARTRLTFDEGAKLNPQWMPDNKRILFELKDSKNNESRVVMKPVDGSGQETTLMHGPLEMILSKVSPDGKFFGYTGYDNDHSQYMRLVPFTEEWSRTAIDKLPMVRPGSNPRPSPDGKWIAYDSQESGRSEIYAAHYPTGEGKTQISIKGGDWPIWSADGREIFYYDGTHLDSAEVQETSTALEVRSVKTLFDVHPLLNGNQISFDATPDGKRFLVIAQPSQSNTTLVYVNDWPAAAKK